MFKINKRNLTHFFNPSGFVEFFGLIVTIFVNYPKII